jgi:hypothetical protein
VAGGERSANAPFPGPETPLIRPLRPCFVPAPLNSQRTAIQTAVPPGPTGANGRSVALAVAAATAAVHATVCCKETAVRLELAGRESRRRRRPATRAAARAGPPGRPGRTVPPPAAAASGSGSGSAWWMGSAVSARRTNSVLAISRSV